MKCRVLVFVCFLLVCGSDSKGLGILDKVSNILHGRASTTTKTPVATVSDHGYQSTPSTTKPGSAGHSGSLERPNSNQPHGAGTDPNIPASSRHQGSSYGNKNRVTTARPRVSGLSKPIPDEHFVQPEFSSVTTPKSYSNQDLFLPGNNQGTTTQRTFGRKKTQEEYPALPNPNRESAAILPTAPSASLPNPPRSYADAVRGHSRAPPTTQRLPGTDSDLLVYPDHPSLSATPEPERVYDHEYKQQVPSSSARPPKAVVPVPDDGGKVLIDAPVKDCGPGMKANDKGRCRVEARK